MKDWSDIDKGGKISGEVAMEIDDALDKIRDAFGALSDAIHCEDERYYCGAASGVEAAREAVMRLLWERQVGA